MNSNQNTKSPQLFWLTETIIVISNTLYIHNIIQLDFVPYSYFDTAHLTPSLCDN